MNYLAQPKVSTEFSRFVKGDPIEGYMSRKGFYITFADQLLVSDGILA
jgi:hypothetical protein